MNIKLFENDYSLKVLVDEVNEYCVGKNIVDVQFIIDHKPFKFYRALVKEYNQ